MTFKLQIECNELVLMISETMVEKVSCVVPPWCSYVVPVVRHRRLGSTTLASFKDESVAKCGRIYYGMFTYFFQWMREVNMVVADHDMLPSGYMVDGMCLNAASRAFGLPKPTLRRHRLGLNDVKCMCGPLSLPAAVEYELVKHVKDLDDMMFGMTAKYLIGLACEVSVAHGIRKFSDVKKSAGEKMVLQLHA